MRNETSPDQITFTSTNVGIEVRREGNATRFYVIAKEEGQIQWRRTDDAYTAPVPTKEWTLPTGNADWTTRLAFTYRGLLAQEREELDRLFEHGLP